MLLHMLCATQALFSWECQPPCPCPVEYAPIEAFQPQPFQLSHIEGKGIGYTNGYTTAEAFLTTPTCSYNNWIPFLDLRGHLFDDGKYAANGGIGLRYVDTRTRVWGANLFYDYRYTHKRCYNQVGLGIESLGDIWDFRFNAYLPVGHKKTAKYDYNFAGFQGNYAYLSHRQELAMRGLDAEVGATIATYDALSLYAAAGPYYFADSARNTVGGKARAALNCWDYVDLEVSGSYDHLFKGIVQGMVSINIPLGPCIRVTNTSSCYCDKAVTLFQKALRPVERQEIIVVERKKSQSVARDRNTGSPLNFVFVDNTSTDSMGTYGNPYATLAAAQKGSKPNDTLYVYAGDGTDNGQAHGIVLKNNQALWGASIDHTLQTTKGAFVIPAESSGLPLITNVSSTAVTLANNNEISGIHIGDSLTGILGNNTVNANINNNLMTVNSLQAGPIPVGYYFPYVQQIAMYNASGDISIVNNQLLTDISANVSSGLGISSANKGTSQLQISNNTFVNQLYAITVYNNLTANHNISGNSLTAPPLIGTLAERGAFTSGIAIYNQNNGNISCSLANNTVLNYVSGIAAGHANSAKGLFSIDDNDVTMALKVPEAYPIEVQNSNSAHGAFSITRNRTESFSQIGTLIGAGFYNDSHTKILIADNLIITHAQCAGILLEGYNAAVVTATINNNQLPKHGITYQNSSSGDTHLSINDNYTGTFGVEVYNQFGGGDTTAIINGNTMPTKGGIATNQAGSIGDLSVCFSNNKVKQYIFENQSTHRLNLQLPNNNIGPIKEIGPITHVDSGICPQ